MRGCAIGTHHLPARVAMRRAVVMSAALLYGVVHSPLKIGKPVLPSCVDVVHIVVEFTGRQLRRPAGI